MCFISKETNCSSEKTKLKNKLRDLIKQTPPFLPGELKMK